MTSFYPNYQNPSVSCFPLQVRLLQCYFYISAGLTNLNKNAKMKCLLVVLVKFRYRKNDLLTSHFQLLHKPLRTWV